MTKVSSKIKDVSPEKSDGRKNGIWFMKFEKAHDVLGTANIFSV